MKKYISLTLAAIFLISCSSNRNELEEQKLRSDTTENEIKEAPFKYVSEQFEDLRILRYRVEGFSELDLKTKTLLYYLYEAALCGRDIFYDQNYKYNLAVRKSLEAIINNYKGDADNEDFRNFMVYAKRVWFSNGIHHHYSHDKILPACSQDFVRIELERLDDSQLPLKPGQSKAEFISFILPVMFDASLDGKNVVLDPDKDVVLASAVNFYEGVNKKEAEEFYAAMSNKNNKEEPSYGINSKLVKENGKITEKVWKSGGMYGPAIDKIIYWLEKASGVSENPAQKAAIDALVKSYRTGDPADLDRYNILWVKDTASRVDVVNGFIEDYHDPLSIKASYESVVSIKDMEASKRIATIGTQAQWFENNSPILPQHKRKNVVGISAKVINAVVQCGDAAPSSAIGINLPNSNWIRENYGSKSVNLGNIVEAYEQAAGGSVVNEFYYNDEIRKRAIECGALADKLHTDMHEVIGHASGLREKGVDEPGKTLRNYSSAIEEGRADLVALYYLMDEKLIELGVMPSLEFGKAAYDDYITNGLIIQLARIEEGQNIEEAHMRNRKMVAEWAYQKGAKDNVIEKKTENGKTYFVVNDYNKLRTLFGELLREVQRITSQGDFKSAQSLIDTYGVKVDPNLHKEVLERYKKLNIAPYAGFIQPRLFPVMENGEIKDVRIEYPEDFKSQMMGYGKDYSLLPAYN